MTHPTWLSRLESIAHGAAWAQAELLGEDWILPYAFWEACETGQIELLKRLLAGLQERPVAGVHSGSVWREQGPHLVRGAILAVRAACEFALGSERGAMIGPLRQAADCFDAAWPAPNTVPLDIRESDEWFAAYAGIDGSGPINQTIGFWTAWDLFDRLVGRATGETARERLHVTAVPGRLARPSRTVRMPLLLYEDDTSRGRLALLTVTLVRDGGNAFCPDVLAMGLTGLRGGQADDDIQASMQQVWRLSGVAPGYRGRWSFTALSDDTLHGHPKPSGLGPLVAGEFSGRSAEAAVCCALWSARGRIPGSNGQDQELVLDPAATITATLEGSDAFADPGAIRLGPVKGVLSKLRASREHMQMVLLSEAQEAVPPSQAPEIVRVPTAGRGFERLLALDRHVRYYQEHVLADWNRRWLPEGEDDVDKNRPPFIDDQQMELLTETDNPQEHLKPEDFRADRLGTPAGEAKPQRPNAWQPLGRDQFLAGVTGEGVDLRRTVITTDAGIGKTSNLEWTHWRINAARERRLALLVPLNEVTSVAEFLPRTLVECFRREVSGKSAENLEQKVAEQILRRLRDAGRLVLLLDALDQAGTVAAKVLKEIATSDHWRACPIIITGRPHALKAHWDRLLSDHRSIGWRFVRVMDFDEKQQKRYLGQTASGSLRYGRIQPEAREILGVPRVLRYLRCVLSDAELEQIRTPSDVYFKSLWHLIAEGMERDPDSRSIGLPPGTAPPETVDERALQRAMELLAAIAFEMTGCPDPGGEPGPNLNQISRGDFAGFVKKIRRRVNEDTTELDIHRLAALNGVLQHGFFDSGDRKKGLQQILWRNASLQEFFAAYWMSQFCTEQDVATLDCWLYLPHDAASDGYYWIWRYAVEMPAEGRETEAWPRAMKPLYRPGDGQNARRSNEMIYRSWQSMEDHARRDPGARQTLADFQGEFEQIRSGQRGPEQQQAAEEFTLSFLGLPGGTFLLGRPKDKPVQADEAEFKWLRESIESWTAEMGAEVLVPLENFPGERGRAECQRQRAAFAARLSAMGPTWKDMIVQVWTGVSGGEDEVAEPRERCVAAFELSRDPLRNCWYRLFDPLHGLTSYSQDYGKYSSQPDTPVIYVSWYDAWVFCKWARWDGQSCRLPGEVEWEYAAKGGKGDAHYWWGDGYKAARCNARGDVGATTVPTDQHANPFGFRDILGNVWEWCQDWYLPYNADPRSSQGSDRVYRGGGWHGRALQCRSAIRGGSSPANRNGYLGFRAARSPSGSGQVTS